MDVLKGLPNDCVELLIVSVQEHRALWDKASKAYKDMQGKDVVWGRIAEIVELPGRFLAWFMTARSCPRSRSIKTISLLTPVTTPVQKCRKPGLSGRLQ